LVATLSELAVVAALKLLVALVEHLGLEHLQGVLQVLLDKVDKVVHGSMLQAAVVAVATTAAEAAETTDVALAPMAVVVALLVRA
jgi:p-aminobenzoyl-glutamate transporter AbgT